MAFGAARKPSMDGSLSERSSSTGSSLGTAASGALSPAPSAEQPLPNPASPSLEPSPDPPQPAAAEQADAASGVVGPATPRLEAEPTPANAPLAGEAAEKHLPAKKDGGAAPGAAPVVVLPHRAFAVPPKRLKLESFDKMIGKQPNSIRAVRLHAPPQQRAYLPQWLASPLGMRPRASAPSTPLPPVAERPLDRSADCAASSSNPSPRPSLVGMEAGLAGAPGGLRRTVSSEAVLAASLQDLLRRPTVGLPLGRRSADFSGDGAGGLVSPAVQHGARRRHEAVLWAERRGAAAAAKGRQDGPRSCPASPPMLRSAFAGAAAEAAGGMPRASLDGGCHMV